MNCIKISYCVLILVLTKNMLTATIFLHNCSFFKLINCMENVLIRSFLWSAFSIIRAEYRNLNAEAMNRLNIRINPKYEKRQIKKTSYSDFVHAVIFANVCNFKGTSCKWKSLFFFVKFFVKNWLSKNSLLLWIKKQINKQNSTQKVIMLLL